MKRLLWIILPALALVGLVALQRGAAAWRTVIDAEPGTLVYAASFDGGAADGFNLEWEQYVGRLNAAVTDGALRLSIGDAERGSYSLAPHHFADFDMTVEARAIEGPENNGYGVIFRAQDRDNYYLFLVSSDGYYAVQRVLNGEPRYLSNWIITTMDLPELNSVRVNTGLNALNRVRVVGQGDTFAFYINDVRAPLCIPNDSAAESVYFEFYATPEERCVQGRMVDTLTDTAIPAGQLGVVARSFGFGEQDRAVVVDFEQVVVYGA
ncbi:MAG: hypothetical protein SF162_15295 [bacterium]|nr:hypothetical protein [bacterium]